MHSILVLMTVAAVPAELSWSVTSTDGQATLTQEASSPTACAVSCELGKKHNLIWRQSRCLGRSTDFVFVAQDCTALVLYEYPLRAERTEATVVAAMASGSTTTTFSLEHFVASPSKLPGEGRRVRWLSGVVGEPGVSPHLSPTGGEVEFGTLDGLRRTVRLSHSGELDLRARAVGDAATAANEGGLYQYTDDSGATEFVMGLNQVPQKFRKRAKPVGSEISSVKAVKMPRSNTPWPTDLSAPPRPAETAAPAPPPPPAANGNCVFGLSKTVCDAVRNSERARPR